MEKLENQDEVAVKKGSWTKIVLVILAIALLVAAVVIVALVVALGVTVGDDDDSSSSEETCNSGICQELALSIKENMNTAADPCEDFYEFACGGFVSSQGVIHNISFTYLG